MEFVNSVERVPDRKQDKRGSDSGGFIFLCPEDRQGLYKSQLEHRAGAAIKFYADVQQLLAECILRPPLAVMIDSQAHVGINHTSVTYLGNLRMVSPVMRCKQEDDGSIQVLCRNPMRTDTLLGALERIEAGDLEWAVETGGRRQIRMEMVRRVRYRMPDGDWQKSNTLNISIGGLFLATHEAIERGTLIEMELSDHANDWLKLAGTVTSVRRWEDSPMPPGVGVVIGDGAGRKKLSEIIRSQQIHSVYRMRVEN